MRLCKGDDNWSIVIIILKIYVSLGTDYTVRKMPDIVFLISLMISIKILFIWIRIYLFEITQTKILSFNLGIDQKYLSMFMQGKWHLIDRDYHPQDMYLSGPNRPCGKCSRTTLFSRCFTIDKNEEICWRDDFKWMYY